MSAIRHGTAPFPVGEVSTGAGNEKLLGLEIQGVDGKEYRLYKSSGAEAAPASKCFKRSAAGGTAVEVAGAGDHVCGVAVVGQVALAADDYFWLQVAGEVTLIKTGTISTPGTGLLLKPAGSAGAVSDSGSTGVDFDPDLPARCVAVSGTVVTAYLLQKLMG
tara:strand:+ start:3524 stop:4009 length:486 start_codon:yes stop_codon:yes gene_type:complete